MSCRYLLASNGVLQGDRDGVLCLSRSERERLSVKLEAEYEVGVWQEETYSLLIAADADPGSVSGEHKGWGLRQMLAAAEDEEQYALLSRAAQLATWHRDHRFCSRCATPLERHAEDMALACSGCGLVHYPRISPCIIVLVRNGSRCLLAHAARFDAGRYSTLAGFIEAGETAEMAVCREVKEEVGIEVGNVTYLCSQSWPFPHSLMLGFMADYVDGELRPDGVEILDAQWFSPDALPLIPPPFTIARRLINHFLAQQE